MVKKLILCLSLSFASLATAETHRIIVTSNEPSITDMNGAVYSPNNGVCGSPAHIIYYYQINKRFPSGQVDLEKNSLFCIENTDSRCDKGGCGSTFHYGPYQAKADCSSFRFRFFGGIEHTDCKIATRDIKVKNDDRWGFDVKLFHPDAHNLCILPDAPPAGLPYGPPPEGFTRIPEHTESVISTDYGVNTNVCLYLQTYWPNHKETHGPFSKTGGTIVIHNTKTVTQEGMRK